MFTTSKIFTNHQVSEEAQTSIILLQISQEQKYKSSTSSERKDCIRSETKLNLFGCQLQTFNGYVKLSQSESPFIHTPHTRMVDLTREFLGMFLKPENIPQRPSQLVKLDITIQRNDDWKLCFRCI